MHHDQKNVCLNYTSFNLTSSLCETIRFSLLFFYIFCLPIHNTDVAKGLG